MADNSTSQAGRHKYWHLAFCSTLCILPNAIMLNLPMAMMTMTAAMNNTTIDTKVAKTSMEYPWWQATFILASFYLGSICGREIYSLFKYDMKNDTSNALLISITVASNAYFCYLIPWYIYNSWAIFFLRLFQGFFQFFIEPYVKEYSSKERNPCPSIINMGPDIGNILGIFLTGCFEYLGMWKTSFYVLAGFALVWSVARLIFLIIDDQCCTADAQNGEDAAAREPIRS